MILFIGCSINSTPNNSNNTGPILTKLSEVHGTYQWNDEIKRIVYSKKGLIEEILSSQDPHISVRTLVSCLNDLSPTNSTMDGKAVVMGLICYEALSQTAYYEHTTSNGDIAEKWAGHIQPSATAKELDAAKRAWEIVLKSKSYVLL